MAVTEQKPDFVDELYSMALHDVLNPWHGLEIIRVPGGWVYNIYSEGNGIVNDSTCFVPFDNEFLRSNAS